MILILDLVVKDLEIDLLKKIEKKWRKGEMGLEKLIASELYKDKTLKPTEKKKYNSEWVHSC